MVPAEKYEKGYAYLLTNSKFEEYLKSRMVETLCIVIYKGIL